MLFYEHLKDSGMLVRMLVRTAINLDRVNLSPLADGNNAAHSKLSRVMCRPVPVLIETNSLQWTTTEKKSWSSKLAKVLNGWLRTDLPKYKTWEPSWQSCGGSLFWKFTSFPNTIDGTLVPPLPHVVTPRAPQPICWSAQL
jgi:hypothetical protein